MYPNIADCLKYITFAPELIEKAHSSLHNSMVISFSVINYVVR